MLLISPEYFEKLLNKPKSLSYLKPNKPPYERCVNLRQIERPLLKKAQSLRQPMFLRKKKKKKKGAPKKDKIQPVPKNFTPRLELVFETPTTKQEGEEEEIVRGKSDRGGGGRRILCAISRI